MTKKRKSANLTMTVLLLLLLLPSLSLCMSPEEEEQLFGSGLSEGVLAAESRRHLSSSVEDLALLFGAERAAAAKLKRMPEAERSKATEAFLASLDYDVSASPAAVASNSPANVAVAAVTPTAAAVAVVTLANAGSKAVAATFPAAVDVAATLLLLLLRG